MGRHSAQEPKLVGAKTQHIVQSAVSSFQVECAVQLALLAEHSRGQFVGEAAITLGESGKVAVAGCFQGRARADITKNLEGRATRGGS
jgi:energy-converting hydrogenase Eha subunit H